MAEEVDMVEEEVDMAEEVDMVEEEVEEPQQKGNNKPGGPCYVCWVRGECLAAVCHVLLVWP